MIEPSPLPWDIISDAIGTPGSLPRAVVVLGGPCSGKSTVRERVRGLHTSGYVLVDSDAEKLTMHREDGESSEAFHVRSRDASRVVMVNAMRARQNIYIEGLSCDHRKSAIVLAALVEAGYYITIVGLTCDPDVAASRHLSRRDGREIPMRIFEEAYAWDDRDWNSLAYYSHEFWLFDSSENAWKFVRQQTIRMNPPSLIATATAACLQRPDRAEEYRKLCRTLAEVPCE